MPHGKCLEVGKRTREACIPGERQKIGGCWTTVAKGPYRRALDHPDALLRDVTRHSFKNLSSTGRGMRNTL
jgi:hypothetical protein